MEMPKSYDIIGDILVFELKEELKPKQEKKIAEEFLKKHKNVKVVAKRASSHEGRYRLRKIKILAGEKRKETLHKENNALLKLDIEKCYFSPRTGTERLRIAKEAKLDEDILVMFSGIAAYPIVISKNSDTKEIYGIEINPTAHKYALKNLELNKINNIKLFKGDVKKVLPKINKKFDKIIMPLPKEAKNYLKLASDYIKKKGIIYLYLFSNEDELKEQEKEIKNLLKDFKIISKRKTGQYAPRVNKYCFELKKKSFINRIFPFI